MKYNSFILLGLISIYTLSCNGKRQNSGNSKISTINNVENLYNKSSTNRVPEELVSLTWINLQYTGGVASQLTLKFYNKQNQGRFEREFTLKDFHSVTKGSIEVDGDILTLYPEVVDFLSGKGDRENALQPKSYKWEINKKDLETNLHIFPKGSNTTGLIILKGISD